MKKLLLIPVAVVGALLAVTAAQAAYSLFGDATLVSPGNASMYAASATSGSLAPPGYGGVSFTVPSGTTVNDLNTLGTDYLVVAGNCGGGSPRFQIRVDMDGDGVASAGDKNIFVYIGPYPNFTLCLAGWQSTGNLLSDADFRVDTSQVGGTFYDTMANAKLLVGGKKVIRISFVVDAYWVVGNDPQTFDVDNVDINGELYTFEPPVPADKDACKDGGWQALTRADFTPFKNQGDCIQYVNTGK
jgi:hypothetical protein